MKQPRVVYWNNIPAPYMVERFNALADRGNVDFEAWFSRRSDADREWGVDEGSWRFRYRYLPNVRVAGRTLAFPWPAVRGPRPDLLVSLYAEPAFVVGWAAGKAKGTPTLFWAEVTFGAWVRRRWWKEWLRRRMFRSVRGVVTAGDDGRAFATQAGAGPDDIHVLPHVIDQVYFAAGAAEARAGRDALRAQLGLVGMTFVYVGRLWRGKGLDHLLDAFAALQSECPITVSLMLVGGGDDEGRFRQRCAAEGIPNVVFVPFQRKGELPRYYAAADVFVFPTLGDPYGLVIDEALACGLPVITTSAAGEVRERVTDGENGFIVPPANSAALLARMRQLAEDDSLREQLARTPSPVACRTPEYWAEEFERLVWRVLDGAPGD